jgi:hypothetical protein
MNKILSALTTVAMITGGGATFHANVAHADGGGVAAGIFGGLIAGAIVGSALAPRPAYPQPVYVAPQPAYPEPMCLARQQVYDPNYQAYRWQRVRVPCSVD